MSDQRLRAQAGVRDAPEAEAPVQAPERWKRPLQETPSQSLLSRFATAAVGEQGEH